MVADVFGLPADDTATADLQRVMHGRLISFLYSTRNAGGGRAYFLPKPHSEAGGEVVTNLRLVLPPVSSLFYGGGGD